MFRLCKETTLKCSLLKVRGKVHPRFEKRERDIKLQEVVIQAKILADPEWTGNKVPPGSFVAVQSIASKYISESTKAETIGFNNIQRVHVPVTPIDSDDFCRHIRRLNGLH